MPAPEPPRRSRPDLSAIPSFLRDASQRTRPTRTAAEAPTTRRPVAIPRPVTPQPSQSQPRQVPLLDPASLPMPSLSRRRVVTIAGVLVAVLLALSFAHQVGDATDAANRADDLRTTNAGLSDEVAQLQADLNHVQDQRFILLEGRSFGLGGPHEIPFALAAGAPALAADAPGSASVRLGAPSQRSPIDAWLEVLFGRGA